MPVRKKPSKKRLSKLMPSKKMPRKKPLDPYRNLTLKQLTARKNALDEKIRRIQGLPLDRIHRGQKTEVLSDLAWEMEGLNQEIDIQSKPHKRALRWIKLLVKKRLPLKYR